MMLGDDEHLISFLFEPRLEGVHVKVVVRAGLRGMRAKSGELTFRPEEWVAFREAIDRSVHDADLAATMRESIPSRYHDDPSLDAFNRAVLATLAGRMRLVHLDLEPIEFNGFEV